MQEITGEWTKNHEAEMTGSQETKKKHTHNIKWQTLSKVQNIDGKRKR